MEDNTMKLKVIEIENLNKSKTYRVDIEIKAKTKAELMDKLQRLIVN
jgi:hypothetical protein